MYTYIHVYVKAIWLPTSLVWDLHSQLFKAFPKLYIFIIPVAIGLPGRPGSSPGRKSFFMPCSTCVYIFATPNHWPVFSGHRLCAIVICSAPYSFCVNCINKRIIPHCLMDYDWNCVPIYNFRTMSGAK